LPVVLKKDIRTGKKPVKLSNGARIYEYSHIVKGATIGPNVMIGQNCYVGAKARIGENTRVQNGNNIWDGVNILFDCFIGPCCNFTNDHDPSDRQNHRIDKTMVMPGATLSTNVTVIAPCVIGSKAMIGAGSVVLRNIKPGERVKWLVK